MSNINEMLLKLEGFQYAISLDLNMGYYQIQLSENKINSCTNITLRVKYCYKCLPIGISNSPDIFQHKMNDLFHEFEFICAYIEELLIQTKGYRTNNVQTSELTINKLKEKDLIVILKCISLEKPK